MTKGVHSAGIRPMREIDLAEVLAIENVSYDFPWTEGIFRDCLKKQYPSMLFVQQKRILAYAIFQFIVDECHLLNLCIRQEERRQGLATKMVQYLMNQARQNDMGSIFLEVRESNTAAIKLYDKLGFNEIGLRRDYYPGSSGREDALVLAHEIV
ncbi:ribosomal-protein-alanine N-acetyltransferase [bacterium BMS3Abin11]|nr:ribosomal-protein-alanine N-acetyltransferase [bacterium BMS3Abin11]GMT39747.1 MAG: ribosomal-protein-alanine acetyltransferase [bacterium]HDH08657.1 ribosomal-protein-alanine N-acetyltransferase [Gammaproteobacteria bacterium]HDZ77963.1 ribosomal-protein-alanine N-acetyltransferase [Gammaproteobacteria bacterium]